MGAVTAISCPGCGADNPLHNPGVVALVCEKCSIVIYREEAQLKAGSESILAPPMSNVTVGATGRIKGRKTSVLGRIRLEHDRGVWDEWYTVDGRGRTIWVVEEEGSFTLETPIDNPLPKGIVDGEVGDSFSYMGVQYQIIERGSGQVKGGEGQLPKAFTPGETFQYVDLTEVDGRGRLTVEMVGTETHGFVGQVLRADQVVFPKIWGSAKHREQGSGVSCSGCGGSIDVRPLPEPAQTVSCKYCGRVHALYGGEVSLLGQNEPRKDLHLMVGTSGILKGCSYEVIGRMVYEELELDDGLWSTIPTTCWEYLLLDQDGEFATLEVTTDGVTLVRKAETMPSVSKLRTLAWGAVFPWRGRRYRMYERGQSTLIYVDGALPWRATLGDTTQFVDFIDMPSIFSHVVPERLSVEWSNLEGAEESEVFLAQDIDPATFAEAFEGASEPLVGRRILRSHRVSPELARFGLMWALLGFLFLGVSFIAGFTVGEALGEVTTELRPKPTSSFSQPFEVEDGALVKIVVDTAVNNSWLWAEVDLVDADSKRSVGFVAKEIGYYHGVEGGESWSEGSRRWKRTFQIPQGGRYRLQVEVSEANSKSNSATATIYRVPFDTKYPFTLSVVLTISGFLLMMLAAVRRPNLWPSDD